MIFNLNIDNMKKLFFIIFTILLFGIVFNSCSGSKNDTNGNKNDNHESKSDIPGKKSENPADFIAYYPFDDNLMDMSGHYNHANKYGKTIMYDTGHKNSCIRFFNKNNNLHKPVNDYLQLPDISVIDFTIAFWVKYEKNKHEYQSVVYSFGEDNIGEGPKDYFAFWVTSIGMLWTSMQSGFNSISTPQIELSKGDWVHVAITVGSDKICFYQNAELYYTKAIDFSHSFRNLPQFVAYHKYYDKKKKYQSSMFSGMVDELYIYNRVLSIDEIKKLFDGN